MKQRRIFVHGLAVAMVLGIAIILRLRAVDRLPQDYDEPVYFLAAQHYARAMLDGDLPELMRYDYNYEHPPLVKLVYAAVLTQLEQLPQIPEQPTNPPPRVPYPLPQPQFGALRLTSAVFGMLQVLVLALLNPLAGLFLAVHTFTIKYTSQAYLEALPALTSTVAVLAYSRSKGRWNGWLAVSGLSLGLTAASKYLYCIAGVAIGVHWLWTELAQPAEGKVLARFGRLKPAALWGIVALAAFFAADPFLWTNPVENLRSSILFSADFAQSQHVQSSGLPLWQPFAWLLMSVPWHPGVFVVAIDVAITLLAVVGLGRLWRQRSVFAVWFVVALAFLLAWPTKWPQYILILAAPLGVCAAEGAAASLWRPAVGWMRVQRRGRGRKKAQVAVAEGGPQMRRALPWLLPGAIVLTLLALFPMFYQAAMSVTDFGAGAIRDGLSGGVWRAAWQGLTGQVEAVDWNPFSFSRPANREVRYAGPRIFFQLLSGAGASILAYEVIWTVLAVLCQAALGVAVALALDRPGVRFKGWWRTVFILPWAIPEFVGALVWAQVFDPRFGWLNLAGESFSTRVDFPVPMGLVARWQEDPQLALVVLLIAATWYGFPFMMLAATAGLKLIPREVYEAAAIDGASPWARFRTITWPLLLPLLLPAVIIRGIFTFNQFYLYYVLQPPDPATTFAITSFYFFGEGGQYAVSAAINIFTVVVLAVLILWFNRRTRAAEGVEYA